MTALGPFAEIKRVTASTAKVETAADAASMLGSAVTGKLERNRASRVAFPPT